MADLTAGQLASQGLCSAACLLSVGGEAAGCRCVCGGRWHGLLAGVVIAGSGRASVVMASPPEQNDILDYLNELD